MNLGTHWTCIIARTIAAQWLRRMRWSGSICARICSARPAGARWNPMDRSKVHARPGSITNLLCRSTLFAMMPRRSWFVLIALVLTTGGWLAAQNSSKTEVQQKRFGARDGRPVILYTLTNAKGMEVSAMNYGGIIQSIRVPDRNGKLA